MAATQIHRLRDLASEIREQLTVTRELIATSLAVLSTPLPGTFLGRKTQKPFPKEETQPLIRLELVQ